MVKIKDPRTYAIIGAAMHVHKVLGHGFLENVYHEALMIEFKKRHIPFFHEVEVPIRYEEFTLKTHYRADFICFENIIVEIKAISQLGEIEMAQVINYLKATRLDPGNLINFGTESLEFHRFKNKFLNPRNPKNPSLFKNEGA